MYIYIFVFFFFFKKKYRHHAHSYIIISIVHPISRSSSEAVEPGDIRSEPFSDAADAFGHGATQDFWLQTNRK